jgi:RecJ-like exonuclease
LKSVFYQNIKLLFPVHDSKDHDPNSIKDQGKGFDMQEIKNIPKLDTMGFPKELIEKLTLAENLIRSTSAPIKVISHYDADGLCAGAVMCAILQRLNKRFHISLEHGLNTKSKLFSKLKGCWTVILDHHKIIKDSDVQNIIHINAHYFGYNGAEDICGSTLAFILGANISPKNWDLIHLGLAGAIGDKQNKHGFQNFNLKILEFAKDHGFIEEKIVFKPHGKTILESIVNSTDPYFTDLSNNEQGVIELLNELEIDPKQSIDNLEKSKLTALSSILSLKLLDQGISAEDAKGVITTKFYSPMARVDLEEFSHQINACGRMGYMGIGVSAGLGDVWAINRAEELRAEYKIKIRSGLKKLEANGLKEMENIQYFYEDVPEFAGTYAGIGMMYFFNQDKPVIALTKTENDINISGRGTPRLIDHGLDLANIFSNIAVDLGGNGGGHNIAAGATIPLDKEQEFLDKVNDNVGKQIKAE